LQVPTWGIAFETCSEDEEKHVSPSLSSHITLLALYSCIT